MLDWGGCLGCKEAVGSINTASYASFSCSFEDVRASTCTILHKLAQTCPNLRKLHVNSEPVNLEMYPTTHRWPAISRVSALPRNFLPTT